MSAGLPAVRARVYLRDSDTFEEAPAHVAIRSAFEEAGARDVSVHRGIMGFDRASGMVSRRPLRFHADQPVVVEAVGSHKQIEDALPAVREALARGLITLTDVALYTPEA